MPTKLTAPMKKMAVFKATPRPVKPRTATSFRSFGPRHMRLFEAPENRTNLFTNVPPAFVGAHNSTTEWMVYAALAVITKSPKDPTLPPYVGGDTWYYQKAQDGGRAERGGSVTDFLVDTGYHRVGINVDTQRWHLMAGPEQMTRDFFLRTHTKSVDFFVVIYDYDFIHDPSGQAVCAVVQKALKLEQNADPLRGGRDFYVVRPGVR
jgi:hypothetical protein